MCALLVLLSFPLCLAVDSWNPMVDLQAKFILQVSFRKRALGAQNR